MTDISKHFLTKRQMELARTEFEILFSEKGDNCGLIARNTSVKYGLTKCPVRGICWRFFLGILEGPPSQLWIDKTKHMRETYASYKEKIIADPRHDKSTDLEHDNPLSEAKDSSWTKYFENQEIEEPINKDLARMYHDIPLLQNVVVMQMIREILLIWAKVHPETGYKQGMHEIAAGLIYCTITTSVAPIDPSLTSIHQTDTLLYTLMDYHFIEADTYALFDAVMAITAKWFFDPVRVTQDRTRQIKMQNLGLSSLNEQNSPQPAEVPTIVRMCRRILSKLKSRDEAFMQKVETCGIEPHVFMMPWIRLLFLREFSFSIGLRIWDAIFAANHESIGFPDFSLVDDFCLCLLLNVRDDVMKESADQSTILSLLMHYPYTSEKDVYKFLFEAFMLKGSKHNALKQSPFMAHIPNSIPSIITHTSTTLTPAQQETISLSTTNSTDTNLKVIGILERELQNDQLEIFHTSQRLSRLATQITLFTQQNPTLPQPSSSDATLSAVNDYLSQLAGELRRHVGQNRIDSTVLNIPPLTLVDPPAVTQDGVEQNEVIAEVQQTTRMRKEIEESIVSTIRSSVERETREAKEKLRLPPPSVVTDNSGHILMAKPKRAVVHSTLLDIVQDASEDVAEEEEVEDEGNQIEEKEEKDTPKCGPLSPTID
ncbi:putative TBC1 domain family member 5 [Blattamonas nauphoetae]|uniref:TBC1 domain family member 5 n=1 Tax=Blattamonas nauphoetae TaxID=2049346 RepID=A0ABQ9XLS7_9EUKA|nr:putative TBC1 domain family member 5 [Blattamonas nauphoetae]